ncbi:MAG TPA: hypothetical protein VGG39_15435 [Polyangiaceae bacterium]
MRIAPGVLVVGGLALASCRQIIGVDGAPASGPLDASVDGAEGGGAACGLSVDAGSCQSCLESACCSQAQTCAKLTSCNLLETCLAGCSGDAVCRSGCVRDHGLGADPATASMDTCLATSCPSECGISCGGLAALFPAQTADCEQCVAGSSSTCGDLTRCASMVDCQEALRCQFSSETVDVFEECAPVGDAGAPSISNSTYPPIASTCAGPCAWGQDWSCLGKVAFPAAREDAIEVTVQVEDDFANAAIQGALVNLCSTGNTSCPTPLAGGTTDALGRVTFQRPAVQAPSLYYLDVTAPGIVETLLFWPFPLSQPAVTIPVVAFESSDLVAFGDLLGIDLQSTAGQVVVVQTDCRLGAAIGVQLAVSPPGANGRMYYFQGDLADPTWTETQPGGTAAAFNVPTVPTTTLTLTGTVGSGQATGPTQFFARPGTISDGLRRSHPVTACHGVSSAPSRVHVPAPMPTDVQQT